MNYIPTKLQFCPIFVIRRPLIHLKTSFEKNCFSAWESKLNMGLINKVDMVCLLPVGYGVYLNSHPAFGIVEVL